MWLQHNGQNHAEAGEELLYVYISVNIEWGRSVISVTLTTTWLLVPDLSISDYFRN